MSFKHPLGCNTILMDTCHPIKVSLTSDHGFSMNNVISNLYFPQGWKTNSAHEPQIQLKMLKMDGYFIHDLNL